MALVGGLMSLSPFRAKNVRGYQAANSFRLAKETQYLFLPHRIEVIGHANLALEKTNPLGLGV